MAKGQMRSNKEKKKPKADKNLKKGGAAPSPFASGKTPAGQKPEQEELRPARGPECQRTPRTGRERRHPASRGRARLLHRIDRRLPAPPNRAVGCGEASLVECPKYNHRS